MHIDNAEDDVVSHKDFIGNQQNGFDDVETNLLGWDGEGNYWSDYEGINEDGHGTSVTPCIVLLKGVGNHPLMKPRSGKHRSTADSCQLAR